MVTLHKSASLYRRKEETKTRFGVTVSSCLCDGL